ncbi:MAG: hypothetical protein JSU57_00595 [Candidatus Heimdallarchaeota archaeon]|nr:MAG: hypothetical protein JSU57_00595 [Candidatus Heimdallarchaeota archaeon]
MRNKYVFGVEDVSQENVGRLLKQGKKIDIRIFGILRFAENIHSEDLKSVVNTCRVYGVISAPDQLKKILIEKKPFST